VTDGRALLLQQDPQLPNCEEPTNRLVVGMTLKKRLVGILMSTEAEARNLGNNLRLTPTQHMHMQHANGCMHGDAKWMLQLHVPTSNGVMHFAISNMQKIIF
jgi:hypothetical protein